MKPKIIKTEADHRAALARIEALFHAKPGTPEGDEFELLSLLVEQFEKVAFPIERPAPVEAIKFRMEQQGLKRSALVPFLGSPSRVSEVLSGKRALTVQMIRKLHDGLGIPMEVLVQEPPPKPLARSIPVRPALKAVKEMCARGYFAGVESWDNAKTRADELLQQFFSAAPELVASPAFNRQMLRSGATEDTGALVAWKTRVLQRAGERKLAAEFDLKAITPAFLRQLAGLSRLANGPALAAELLESHGLAVVVERHLPGTWLDGAALRLPKGTPVIGLTLRHDRLDNFWFCLFHELGHVVKHIATGKAESFLDDLDAPSKDKREREADEFAREVLVPRKDWKRFLKSGVFDHITVRREARRLLVDGSILAGRIRAEKKNFQILTSLVGHGRLRKHFK